MHLSTPHQTMGQTNANTVYKKKKKIIKHYRVHRSSAKHSLFIGCMCKQTAIFFLSTTETPHCTFKGLALNMSTKWTVMQQTSQRNSYHGELQEITGPAGNANGYRQEQGSETERTLVLYRAPDSSPFPPLQRKSTKV